jgi:hypothetical protein
MKEINKINLEDFTKQKNDYIRQYNYSNQIENEFLMLNQISFFKRLILKLQMFLGLIKI